jgi:hypothetical protein
MATRKIVKFKIRRGQDSQRKTVIFNQGEPVYTTDTRRVFIGDGLLSGGHVIGNIAHQPLSINGDRVFLSNALTGDIVNENGYLYQLSGSDYSVSSAWAFIGTKPDNITVEYDAQRSLSVKNNSISGNKFASNAAYNLGGLVATSSNGLSANIDRETLTITSTNQLSVFRIKPSNIHSSVAGNGLSGGNGNPLSLLVGPEFSFDSGVLRLSSVTFAALSSYAGAGLSVSGGKIVSDLRTVNSSSFDLVLGQIDLKDTSISPGVNLFSNLEVDSKGRVVGATSTIFSTLCCNQSTASNLSTFNGRIDQTNYENQTIISTLSTNGVSVDTISLSSAGFALLDTQYGKIAIPIFKYE